VLPPGRIMCAVYRPPVLRQERLPAHVRAGHPRMRSGSSGSPGGGSAGSAGTGPMLALPAPSGRTPAPRVGKHQDRDGQRRPLAGQRKISLARPHASLRMGAAPPMWGVQVRTCLPG
jgi:hypothetical protein